MRRRARGRRGEGGSATLEAVLLTPALILLLNLAVFAGRYAVLHAAVRQAAEHAARVGSTSRDLTSADTNAGDIVQNFFYANRSDVVCSNPDHPINDAAFLTRPVAGAMYSITVTCDLPVVYLLPGMTTSIHVSFTAYSPLDPYRCNGAPGTC